MRRTPTLLITMLLPTLGWAQGPAVKWADLDKYLPNRVAWTNQTDEDVSLDLVLGAADAAGYVRIAMPVKGHSDTYTFTNLVNRDFDFSKGGPGKSASQPGVVIPPKATCYVCFVPSVIKDGGKASIRFYQKIAATLEGNTVRFSLEASKTSSKTKGKAAWGAWGRILGFSSSDMPQESKESKAAMDAWSAKAKADLAAWQKRLVISNHLVPYSYKDKDGKELATINNIPITFTIKPDLPR